MYDRRGKSILRLVLQSYLNSKLYELIKEPEAKVENIWFDELGPDPVQTNYGYQGKQKAQWKREINPRKH